MEVAEQLQIRAKVVSATGYNNQFYRLKCQQGRNAFDAVGVLFINTDLSGTVCMLTGNWKTHPSFGTQFAFSHVEPEGSELYFFLSRICKGLGEALAAELVNFYGEDNLVEILNDRPKELLLFKGIGNARLSKIIESWAKYAPLKALSSLLIPYGVPSGQVVRIYNHMGDKAEKIIRENPYALTRIPGIGFKKADSIAMKLGVAHNDPFRIDSCIVYVMTNMAEDAGDTLVPPEKVWAQCLKELNGDVATMVNQVDVEARIKAIWESGELVEMGDMYALVSNYRCEKAILQILERRLNLPVQPIMWGKQLDDFIVEMAGVLGIPAFGPEQERAIRLLAEGHKSFVLAGYAGSGKSSISRALLTMLARKYGEKAICACALSGIASDRIRKLTGYHASTIHTTLKWRNGSFEYNSSNKLPFKVVLIDETSMVSIQIFLRLLEAVPDDAYLGILGDEGQISPIGAGAVLTNLVESGLLPMTKLTKIYRQSEDSRSEEHTSEL